MTIPVVTTADDLSPYFGGAFVPTMGALHDGHLALVRRAAELGGPVVVSVFVNPKQFGPGEDFEQYPRQIETDAAQAGAAGADVVFAPEVDVVYPPDAPLPAPELPDVARDRGLEDTYRPGHFAGVCQVVARLFDLVRPAVAVFGQKDYQQLLLVRGMVEQQAPRWGDLSIADHPTMREADGLARSSRNRYLTPTDRARALGLFLALVRATGAPAPAAAEEVMRTTLLEHDLEIDYAAVRDAKTLAPITTYDRPARGLVAARLGPVRLIDNLRLGPT